MARGIPKWRLAIYLAILPLAFGGYWLWSPGADFRDGRHDLGKNGMWLQHGWIGDDHWFKVNQRDKTKFRSRDKIDALVQQLQKHHIRYVYPHLAPAAFDGKIAGNHPAQTEMFLDACGAASIEVIPWIGGVFDHHCQIDDPEWRTTFATSVADLFDRHPRVAGVQINIEPLRSGNADFLVLLDEVKAAMPPDKILSVAAYPPPTNWHRFPEVHWDEAYFAKVANRVDQLSVMMYDTALPFEKLYEQLMANWTQQLLEWTPEDCEILLGVAVYDDADVDYHDPRVENLESGLAGIHAGLSRFEPGPPPNYAGVAIYCEWEMDDAEWALFSERFLRKDD